MGGGVGTLNGSKGLFTDHNVAGKQGHVKSNQFSSASHPAFDALHFNFHSAVRKLFGADDIKQHIVGVLPSDGFEFVG